MYAKLFGKLLGYPGCCIDYFIRNKLCTAGDISYNGFRPCIECVKKYPDKEAIEKMLNRDLAKPPTEFTEYVSSSNLGKAAGIKIYAAVGKKAFFLECWEFAFNDKT